MEKNEEQNNERRLQSRISSLNFVSYTYLDAEHKLQVEDIGRTLDISTGGIKLEVPASKIPTSEIELNIALKEAVIKVKGEIAHKKQQDENKCELGIRFIDMAPENQKVLDDFLQET